MAMPSAPSAPLRSSLRLACVITWIGRRADVAARARRSSLRRSGRRLSGALRVVLRTLPLVVRGLLLGSLLLRADVRGRDELLATAPAERPDEEENGEDDVPGRRH